jgi:hypothetical protein
MDGGSKFVRDLLDIGLYLDFLDVGAFEGSPSFLDLGAQ